MDIMTPKNRRWNEFIDLLEKESHMCDAKSLRISKRILKQKFPEIDVESSLEYFREHGGFCDCEVIMNVHWGSLRQLSIYRTG